MALFHCGNSLKIKLHLFATFPSLLDRFKRRSVHCVDCFILFLDSQQFSVFLRPKLLLLHLPIPHYDHIFLGDNFPQTHDANDFDDIDGDGNDNGDDIDDVDIGDNVDEQVDIDNF